MKVNFHSIFQFLPFPVKHSAVTKCCEAYYQSVIDSAKTMYMINAGIWDIDAFLTKQTLNYFQDFAGEFIFLFLVFLILRLRRRPCCSFSSQHFSRSWRSFLTFSWRFKFSCFKIVKCWWSMTTVETISSNWFLYVCTIFEILSGLKLS